MKRVLSDEARAKMSAAVKARWTPELRAALATANRERVLSPESRAKLSAAHQHDLIGQRFGRLIVLSQEARESRVRCDCGKEKVVASHRFVRGATRSCGCLSAELSSVRNRTHGSTQSGVYRSWNAMRNRCLFSTNRAFQHYGGRGISVCERWLTFENFRADMGERPEGLTLDRIDPDGDYRPENCRWATRLQQTHNRRVSEGRRSAPS